MQENSISNTKKKFVPLIYRYFVILLLSVSYQLTDKLWPLRKGNILCVLF
jgi:hypothetical protein